MDPSTLKIVTLVIFLTCYGLSISRKIKIAYVAIASAIALLIVGAVTPQQAFDSINWNVLGIYWGFMMLSISFSYSGMPSHIAHRILRKTESEGKALLTLCALAAFLSSFLENVGVTLMMIPIAIELSKKAKSSLFIYIVSVAISANIVTTVTMIADPPSLILASETGMSFMNFYWFQGKIGLGIISIFGAVAGLATLYLINFRGMKKSVSLKEEKAKINYIPSALFIGGIFTLAINSYIGVSPGAIGLVFGIIAMAIGSKNIRGMATEFDWNSFIFIFGIFIVVGAVQTVGILQDFSNAIFKVGLNNPIVTLAILTWISVALSSFIDNVPYTMLMIPVCTSLANLMGVNPFPFLYGMLIGTGIGGNITPVGATANVFACGILEKRGYKIKLKEYMKISVPMTIVSVLVSYLLLQLLWM